MQQREPSNFAPCGRGMPQSIFLEFGTRVEDIIRKICANFQSFSPVQTFSNWPWARRNKSHGGNFCAELEASTRCQYCVRRLKTYFRGVFGCLPTFVSNGNWLSRLRFSSFALPLHLNFSHFYFFLERQLFVLMSCILMTSKGSASRVYWAACAECLPSAHAGMPTKHPEHQYLEIRSELNRCSHLARTIRSR